MSESTMISRGGSRHGNRPPVSSAQRKRGGSPAITCNRCRKPLSTTCFVVACNCVFCEECTYSHFQTSPNCPSCDRVLSENDFKELVIADPSSAKKPSASLQNIFTKQHAQAQSISFQDLCQNIMKSNEDLQQGTKFLFMQFLKESSKQNARSRQTVTILEKLKHENTSLKQTQNSQRMKYEQAIEKLQQQLHSTHKKLDEKEQQLVQFRRLHSSSRSAPISPRNDGGPRRVSGAGMGPSHSQQVLKPPIHGFMIQKEAQERAKQRVLESPQYRRPIMGGGSVSKENYRPPSNGNGYHQQHSQHRGSNGGGSSSVLHTSQRPYSGGTVGSGGIRNLTSSSGFAFSGGMQKRHRPSVGGSGVSPGNAFVNHPPGSYNVTSPSSAFQNRGGEYHRQYS